MSEQQDQEKNIAQGLSQLGETTTAAELLRQKGQTKKLRVISEKQLMDWILRMLQQHMAGKEDAFSDIEKTEMLKKTQEELGRRIKREQEAQAERDRLKAELEQAMSAVAAGSSAASQADVEMALAALKEKLEQAEQINLDLQQDNYDLQDQLNEKMALISTTIAEKDKLRDTVRHQMMRMTTLCEGVLGIDNDYYGSRHQNENEVSEEATQDEQFYHDFDVSAKVITTLQADLERLRGILKREEEQGSQVLAVPSEAKSQLLEADLALLEQLKSGNLEAVDVAAPIAGLLEAMEGARIEAESFEQQVAEATGAAHGQVFTELPDATGDPAHVLAGATTVTRELAASLARNRNRIAALKAIADESDEARHGTEEELESTQAALESVCTSLRQRAESERIRVPIALSDREAPPEDRAKACTDIVDHLQAASPVDAAAIEQLALTDRLVKPGTPAIDVQTTDKHIVADRLRKAGLELERYTLDLQRQLDEAATREQGLAEQVRDLARSSGADVPTVRELERSLEMKADPQLLAEVTAKALSEIAGSSGRQASQSAAMAEDRLIAEEIVRISQGDQVLAERVADLALSSDEADPKQQIQLSIQVREAIAALGDRKASLETQVAELKGQLDAIHADQGRGSAEAQRLQGDLEKARADLQKANNDVLRLRSGREAANAALDVIATELKQRVPDAHPDLTDRASEPQARAEAARASISKLAHQRTAANAAIDAVAAIDRAMARTGGAPSQSEKITASDEIVVAERLREATRQLEERISSVSTELDAARLRERELAKQVRDLSAAHAVVSPASAPKDDLNRLDRALAENATPADLADATRRLIAGLKAKAVRNEALSTAARGIAGEVAKSGEGDPELANQTADLAVAIDNPDADPGELESLTRTAIVQLAIRKRAVETERNRLAAELAKHEQRKAERSLETGRIVNETGKLKAQNAALAAAIDQLTSELAQRAGALGLNVPGALTDTASEPGVKASAALAALADLAEHRQIEDAVRDHLQTAERLLTSTDGPHAGLVADLKPGDEKAVADRLRKADSTLDRHVRDLHQGLGSAKARERDQAKQVRELAVAQSVGGSPAVPREDIARLERAIADLGSTDLAEAVRRVLAAMKANTGRAESEARSAVARSLAAELVKASEGDASLAESAAGLAVALESEAHDPNLESDLREALLKLAARKRAVDAERTRLISDLEAVRAERVAALARLEEGESARRDEVDRLTAELAAVKDQLEEAQAEADEFKARNEVTGSQFSGEMVTLRAELNALRARHQEQAASVATLRQAAEAGEARLKRQREELTRGLEERDNLIAEKDRTIDQLSTQRIDAKAQQAKLQALGVELDAANSRIRDLESRSGDQAGQAVRSGDLAELHKRTMGERDQLREQKRAMEADLADARGTAEQVRAELGELRRQHQIEIETHAREVGEERDKVTSLQEMLRKLREEVVGLKARQRKAPESK
jgi:hypothetical protein